MAGMNALQRALVRASLAEEPKERKHKSKEFKCNKCGEVMEHPSWGNFMYCKNCDSSFFIFSNKKDPTLQ